MTLTEQFIPPLFFISDVHLGIGEPDAERVKQQRLLTLFDTISKSGGSLFIVGDLFDFWYEYRSVIPRGYHRLLSAMEMLTASGQSIVYIAGNHDFALGDFFSIDLGVKVFHDDLHFTVEGKRFYIYHGDGLMPRDRGYRILKRVLRCSLSQRLFRLLHPDLGFGLARRFSHTSRDLASTRLYGETDGMRDEASRRMATGTDIVIMGHRHLPIIERMNDGLYINLGDWITHFTFAKYENGSVTLYSLNNGSIEAYPETT